MNKSDDESPIPMLILLAIIGLGGIGLLYFLVFVRQAISEKTGVTAESISVSKQFPTIPFNLSSSLLSLLKSPSTPEFVTQGSCFKRILAQ